MLKRLLPVLILLIAITILGLSIWVTNVQQHTNTNKVEPTHEERVEVVEGEDATENNVISEERGRVGKDKKTTGKASWYGKEICGSRYGTSQCKTASGEIFDENAYTFAHRTMAFGTRISFCVGTTCVVAVFKG